MDTSITPAELQELLAGDQDVTVMDVRRKDDFAKNPKTFGQARWHDPAEIDQWLATVPTDQPVVVYCVRGGSVSQSVQQRLAEKGCKVSYVEGGLAALDEQQSAK